MGLYMWDLHPRCGGGGGGGGGGRWPWGGGVMNGILFLFADPRVFSNVWEFITGSVVKLINEVFCGRLSG